MKKFIALGLFVALSACGDGDATTDARDTTTTVAVSTTNVEIPTTVPVTSSSAPASSSTAPGSSEPTALLGAWVAPRGEINDANRRQAILDHEALIGRPLALVNEFFPFGADWHMDRLRWHVDRGTGLMISWNGTHVEQILDGTSDDLIRERARWTNELEVPLIMRFFWEPDASKGRDWGYHDDPALYGQVWRHVRSIFDEEGVTNARWLWTPTTWHFTTGSAPSFYPGDDVVELIGADGYLWSPCQDQDADAAGIFGDFLAWAQDRPQPIVVGEWGVDADGGSGTKAGFINSMRELFAPMDRLFAIVMFDAVDPGGRGCDWRIDTSDEALAAYVEFANDPRFAQAPSAIGDL